MSSSHYHMPGGTQNQGNWLGDRACVRQSRLSREQESGNAMKGILGAGHLNWDLEKREGAFAGRPVYNHITAVDAVHTSVAPRSLTVSTNSRYGSFAVPIASGSGGSASVSRNDSAPLSVASDRRAPADTEMLRFMSPAAVAPSAAVQIGGANKSSASWPSDESYGDSGWSGVSGASSSSDSARVSALASAFAQDVAVDIVFAPKPASAKSSAAAPTTAPPRARVASAALGRAASQIVAGPTQSAAALSKSAAVPASRSAKSASAGRTGIAGRSSAASSASAAAPPKVVAKIGSNAVPAAAAAPTAAVPLRIGSGFSGTQIQAIASDSGAVGGWRTPNVRDAVISHAEIVATAAAAAAAEVQSPTAAQVREREMNRSTRPW